MNWHHLAIEDVLETQKTSWEGLSSAEVRKRLEEFGPNELEEKKKKPAWQMFLAQFKDVMILILIAAAVISGFIGDLKDTIVILVIVVINAIVGFIQEYRAEKAMDALKKMSAAFSKVRRDGQTVTVSSSELVPGDIVFLEAGDVVPADLRLLESHALRIGEASLTGESNPIEKITTPLEDEKAQLGDRLNMAYKTTLVTYGRGAGVVTATGMKTEIGAIATMLQDSETATPLQKRLVDFGKKISIAVLAICVVIYVAGLLRGEDPVMMLLTAISVAVAAIPEALPAVVTIALAMGAGRMVKQNALIRKLPAVETLGSVTYICTDKTGTLTQNKMTVREQWQAVDKSGGLGPFDERQLFLFCLIANQDTRQEGSELKGDPTELAIVSYVQEQAEYNVEWNRQYKRIFELPFDSDRKMMTTVHQIADTSYLVITKGAEESILKVCVGGGEEAINKRSDELSGEGQRVLAYAYKFTSFSPEQRIEHLEKDLYFCGLIGLIDPPRTEAQQAVKECRSAGIVPVMITGDHPITASVIAGELGIYESGKDKMLTGEELAELSQEQFEAEVLATKVYARVSPEQKLQIVTTLQGKNQFVAMTGDGVNDAPALKKANIGVAMGITGTEVSKEAAHMILLDDNFSTIVKSVKEGRRIFDNIRKFIRYAMTGNSGEIWTIFLAPLIGLPIPLLPIHILWINLVTDGLPGLALAKEPAEKGIMQRPPRHPEENIFSHGLGWHILWVGLLIGAVCLGVQAWAINTGRETWQTMVFTVLCLSQLGHVMAIKSEHSFLFKQNLLANKALLGAVAFTFLLQMLLIYVPPFQKVFSIQALSLQELLICIAASCIPYIAVEIEKYIRNRKGR